LALVVVLPYKGGCAQPDPDRIIHAPSSLSCCPAAINHAFG
jgi:hypothetical protein